MKKLIVLVCMVSLLANISFGACPSTDLTDDCEINLEDLAVIASGWLTTYNDTHLSNMASEWLIQGIPEDPAKMAWVTINDDGVAGHEAFNGEMSRYETTNAQYCEYLNAALASDDITVGVDNIVYGASVSNVGIDFIGQVYYYLAGSGSTYNGATNGGAARINWNGSSFTVDSGFDNHPVTYVSWYGSSAFASYYGWRLPTEWEWQAVADYDGSYTYGHGPGTINNSLANYRNSTHPDGTTTVGAYGAIHGYGMNDMAGNVYEWTNTVSNSTRVIRGGSWNCLSDDCTVSYGYDFNSDDIYSDLGFRVCR